MRISDWSSDVCSSDLAVELADDQAGIRLLEHAVPGQVAGIGEARVAMQGLLRRLEDQHQQQGAGKQRQAEPEIAGYPDPTGIGHDLRQVDRLDVGVVRDRKSTSLNSSH